VIKAVQVANLKKLVMLAKKGLYSIKLLKNVKFVIVHVEIVF
jgi:hypothetical protein